MNNITTKKNKIKYILLFVVLVILVFALVFLLYDSPAKYVTKPDGSIYLDDKGEPILYYKIWDLFGIISYNQANLTLSNNILVLFDLSIEKLNIST